MGQRVTWGRGCAHLLVFLVEVALGNPAGLFFVLNVPRLLDRSALEGRFDTGLAFGRVVTAIFGVDGLHFHAKI